MRCFCFRIQEHCWQTPNPSCRPCIKPGSGLCTCSHAQRTLLLGGDLQQLHQGAFSELTSSLCLQWKSPAFNSACFKSYRRYISKPVFPVPGSLINCLQSHPPLTESCLCGGRLCHLTAHRTGLGQESVQRKRRFGILWGSHKKLRCVPLPSAPCWK